MAGYIGSKVAVVSSGAERKKVFTATSGQTSFTGLSYTVNNVHVFQNGVRLVDGTDYTATNGNSITLTVGAATDDQVVVVSYNTFQTSDTVSASAGGTFSNAVTIDADGATVLTVDRATSNGTIIDLQKSGSSVGVVGVNGDRIYLTNAQEGIMIDQSANNLSPTSSTGTFNDNAMSLGESGNRWKDLYLSGGVVFGDAGGSGTSSSNSLDSYEEGTFTPTFTASSGTMSVGYNSQIGRYTKVGRIVHAIVDIQASGAQSGGSGDVRVSGFPFNFASSPTLHAGAVGFSNNWVSGVAPSHVAGQNSASYVTLRRFNGNSEVNDNVSVGSIQTSSRVYFQITYETT